ncbi:MAG: hypothetical protein GF315_05035 [candidate division Zixibacteria bacterium]|nr:hypothetical protein [candidate division Zixibacteria bacterium]
MNTRLNHRSVKFVTERYCKRSGIDLPRSFDDSRLIYIPFWRFNGMIYQLRAEAVTYTFSDGATLETEKKVKVDSKPFDINFPGVNQDLVNQIIMGIRSQVMELHPQLPPKLDKDADIIKPEITLDAAREMAYSNAFGVYRRKNVCYEELIGEKLTLIYFPVWISRFTNKTGAQWLLLDGVSKRGLACGQDEFRGFHSNGDFDGVGSIKILPHHCPNCGADLPAGKNAIVYTCQNCWLGWYLDGDRLRQIEIDYVDPGGDKNLKFFPFWEFGASFNSRGSILTYHQAQMLFRSKLSVFVDDSEDAIFRFFVPGFSARNPRSLWKLSSRLTQSQPKFTTSQRLRFSSVPATLPEDEAAQMARAIWFYLIFGTATNSFQSWNENSEVPEVNFHPGKLIYLPMKEEGIYLREQFTGFAVQKRGIF